MYLYIFLQKTSFMLIGDGIIIYLHFFIIYIYLLDCIFSVIQSSFTDIIAFYHHGHKLKQQNKVFQFLH